MLPWPFWLCVIFTLVLKAEARLSSIFLKAGGRFDFEEALGAPFAVYIFRTSSSVCLTDNPFFFISVLFMKILHNNLFLLI